MKGVEALMGIIMIMVSFIIFPMVMTGTHEVRTDAATATGNVTTGGGVTTGAVSLTGNGGLYNDSTDSITSLASDLGADTPIVSSYNISTAVLTVGGFAASQNRTITVAYEYDATTDYTGLGSLTSLAPTLVFLALLFSGVGIVWHSFKGGRG